MAVSYNQTTVYAVGVNDKNAMARYYNVPEEQVIDMPSLARWNTANVTGDTLRMEIVAGLLASTNCKVVVGRAADLSWPEKAALKDLHSAHPQKRQVIMEETALCSVTMRETLRDMPVIESKEDVIALLRDIMLYQVDMEDNPETFIVRVPFSASHEFRWVSDNEIYYNGSKIKKSVVVALADDPWSVAPQMIIGMRSPKEVMTIMMAILWQHKILFGRSNAHAINVLLGFTGVLGPKEIERKQLTADGLKVKEEYAVGVLPLTIDDIGRLYAGSKFDPRADRSSSRNRANLMDICSYMQKSDATSWYTPDNRGEQVLRVPVSDMMSGGGPLGITMDNGEVVFSGSNIKGLLKSAVASHGGSHTCDCVVVSHSPLTQGGQALMSASELAKVKSERILKVGGEHRYSGADVAVCIHEVERSHLLVNKGDTVKPGDAVLEFMGNVFRWDALDGAVGGIVVDAVKRVSVHGARGPKGSVAEYGLQLYVEILAYDMEAAKGRDAFKAMMQTYEAHKTMVKYNNQIFGGLLVSDGLIKNSSRFRKLFKEKGRGEIKVSTQYEAEGYAVVKALYDKPEWHQYVQFDDDHMIVTTTEEGIYGEVTFLVESSSVQENVGSAAMTLYQILFLSFTEAGRKVLNRSVTPDIRRRTMLLGYLSALGAQGARDADGTALNYMVTGPILLAYRDSIPLDTKGMSDVDLLDRIQEMYPNGINIVASEDLIVAIDPQRIKEATAPDGLGSGLTGLGETVARLLRVMCDPLLKARLLDNNANSLIGLMTVIKINAAKLAKSGGFGRVYGTRWGVTAKVLSTRWQSPETVMLHPASRIAKRLARKFRCKIKELNGKAVYVVRHPVIVGYVARIVLDSSVNPHCIQVSEIKWRRVNQGDFDGDTGCLFPIPDDLADQLTAEMETLLPRGDMNLHVYGVPAEHPQFGMFGEVLKVAATPDDLVNKFTRKPREVWFEEIKAGVEANTWWTGTSYRLMESGAIQYALGLTNSKLMMLGAWLYEHKGLAGKNVGTNTRNFLQSWIWPLRSDDDAVKMLTHLKATMGEVEGYTPKGDFLLPHAVIVGNHLNRSLKPDGLQLEIRKPFDIRGNEVAYDALAPLFRMVWLLGRKQLSKAVADCQFVNSELMDQLAELHGFKDTFIYNMVRLVAKQIATTVELLGGLVDTNEEEEDLNGYDDEW